MPGAFLKRQNTTTMRLSDKDKLMSIRSKHELSQNELAIILGYKHKETVSRIEGGTQKVSGPVSVLLGLLYSKPSLVKELIKKKLKKE